MSNRQQFQTRNAAVSRDSLGTGPCRASENDREMRLRFCAPEQILTHPTRIQIREYAQLIYPYEGYLNINYTQDIIFIQVFWVSGRITETKKAFIRIISDDLHAKARARKEDVWIVLIDADRTDWSFGNGEMQYEPKLASMARNQSLCLCPCPCGNVGASVETEFAAGHLAFRIRTY